MFPRKFYSPEAGGAGVATETPEEGEHQYDDLEIDGKVERVRREVVKADAQKWRSQGPKLQSERDKLAAEIEQLKEEHAGAEEFIADFGKVLQGGDEGKVAMKKMAVAMGWSEADLEARLAAADEDETDDDDGDEDEKPVKGKPRPKPVASSANTRVGMDQFDPEIRRELEYARQMRLRELRQGMFNDLSGVLEADDYLGKLMKDDRKGKVLDVAQKALQRRVGLERQAPGPQTYKAVAQEVRDWLKGLGIQEAEDKPKGAEAFGIGEADLKSFGDELHREQPPKREPVTSGDYRTSFRKRLLHKIIKGGGLKAEDGQ